MDVKDILALVGAGFTKEDILALGNVQAQKPAVPAEAPAPVPAEAPAEAVVAEPTPAPAPQPTPQPAEEQPSMADVMRQIAKLTASVQANALANTSIPSGADPRNGLTGEDALAQIIRPTFGGR